MKLIVFRFFFIVFCYGIVLALPSPTQSVGGSSSGEIHDTLWCHVLVEIHDTTRIAVVETLKTYIHRMVVIRDTTYVTDTISTITDLRNLQIMIASPKLDDLSQIQLQMYLWDTTKHMGTGWNVTGVSLKDLTKRVPAMIFSIYHPIEKYNIWYDWNWMDYDSLK